MDVLLIGYGAVAQEVLQRISPEENARISSLILRANRAREVKPILSRRGVEVVSSLEELSQLPALVAECAGHEAVRAYGMEFLRRGVNFLVISIGALADQKLYSDLITAAEAGGAKLILAAGAVAGVDALVSARVAGLKSVQYTSRKPPRAWIGTKAEKECDLNSIDKATTFYEGTARKAAIGYPQNANVAATIALAGLGFSETIVRLIADPNIDGNIHQIRVEGVFGSFEMEIKGNPLPGNPKTSMLAAHSVVAEIRRRASSLEIGG